jgi:hypothetical protein
VTDPKAEDKNALLADVNIQNLLTAQGEGLISSLAMAYAGA